MLSLPGNPFNVTLIDQSLQRTINKHDIITILPLLHQFYGSTTLNQHSLTLMTSAL